MNSRQTIEVKNLSSRKLWELVSTGRLPPAQLQLAEQELLLRRRHLDHRGNLHPASAVEPQSLHHH
ncbi:Uncharacterised protein [Halioglobus japonicus]|nr:Uncharacterised protein [Halioglobus japonicus]